MKKILGFLLITLVSPPILAEGTEISIFNGYRTTSSVEDSSTGDKLNLDETSSYGIIVAKDYGSKHVMEFLYSKQDTDLKNVTTYPNTKIFDLDVEYFQIGGSQIWADDKLDKFFGATLGVVHFDPVDTGYADTTRFAMSFGGGIVYKVTRSLGLRFEVRGYFSALGSSSTLCGSGGKCLIVRDELLSQFDFNAGLRFRF